MDVAACQANIYDPLDNGGNYQHHPGQREQEHERQRNLDEIGAQESPHAEE
jgi:hypothetical protein